eukprot:1856893-Rhodomonas_salina.1
MKAPGLYFPTTHTPYCLGERVSICPPSLLRFFPFLVAGLLSRTLSVDFCLNSLFYTVPYRFTAVMP